MTKGLAISHTRGNPQHAPILKMVLGLNAFAVTVDGATGVGWGTAVMSGLPEGNFMLLGAVANVQFSGSGADAGLGDTWAGDFGVGTTPATDGTITAGDVDIVPSTALAAATAEVSPRTRGVQADGAFCGVIFDNTASTLEVNLNLLIDDVDISADGVAITADGYVIISYVMLGDD